MKSIPTPRPWSEYSNQYHPKQRIFLSIDAIGSTKLKVDAAKRGHTIGAVATNFVNAFLPEVPVIYKNNFLGACNKYCQNCSEQCTDTALPIVWKYIGDEVVLVAELTCIKRQASLHILALAQTIKDLNASFAKQPDELFQKLRFKGTAWVAGFPVTNIELELLSGSGTKECSTRDFLGPSIDLGFRLSKLASDDRLVISASLAYLIVSQPPFTLEYNGTAIQFLPLCFGGTVEAKGTKNEEHPLIWISINNTRESDLCKPTCEQLKGYLEDYLKTYCDHSIFPFILDNTNTEYQLNYDDEYKKAVKEQMGIPNSIFYNLNTIEAAKKSTTDPKRGEDMEHLAEIINRLINESLDNPNAGYQP